MKMDMVEFVLVKNLFMHIECHTSKSMDLYLVG